MGDITQVKKWYEKMDYNDTKRFLDANIQQMSKSFVAIGFGLKRIRDNEMYLEDGCKSIWDFAEERYSISRSTATRWMAMNDRFSDGGNSPILADQYKSFGKSQLQEMLYLTDEQAAEVTEDMTVKEIRELRKSAEDEPKEQEKELGKPDKIAREYLNAAARHLIKIYHDWMLEDFSRRVTDVMASPDELKKKLEGKSRCHWFATEKKVGQGTMVAHINLFDDCVQIWNENSRCIGDYDWFYLAAAIQSQWNMVALEKVQEELKAKRTDCATSHIEPEAVAVEPEPQEIEMALGRREEEASQPEDPCDVAQPQEPDVIDGEYRECCDDAAEEPVSAAETQRKDIDVLRDMLRKEKHDLEEWVKVDKVDPLPSGMIQKKKLLVGALASMIYDLEEMEEQEEEPQLELPLFKNNDQRKEWLRNYKDWGLWYEDKHIGARYYRYQFGNGAVLVAEEYHQPATEYIAEHDISYLHLIGGPEPLKGANGIGKWQRHERYNRYPNNETELVEFLKETQKGKRE